MVLCAPLFWGLLLGLPGLVTYKAINTMDSMIGHLTDRYRHFGWFAARSDDVMNYIPARLTALLFFIVSLKLPKLKDFFRDAQQHQSVNAGWPEAALACALHVRVSGPRSYAGQNSNQPWVNERATEASAEHLTTALQLYRRLILTVFTCLLAWWGLNL